MCSRVHTFCGGKAQRKRYQKAIIHANSLKKLTAQNKQWCKWSVKHENDATTQYRPRKFAQFLSGMMQMLRGKEQVVIAHDSSPLFRIEILARIGPADGNEDRLTFLEN